MSVVISWNGEKQAEVYVGGIFLNVSVMNFPTDVLKHVEIMELPKRFAVENWIGFASTRRYL
jgi:hypothetical protein